MTSPKGHSDEEKIREVEMALDKEDDEGSLVSLWKALDSIVSHETKNLIETIASNSDNYSEFLEQLEKLPQTLRKDVETIEQILNERGY